MSSQSFKQEAKAVQSPDTFVRCEKRCGYRNRFTGATLYVQGKPTVAMKKLCPCTRASCTNEEQFGGKPFLACTYCLTVYCSTACSSADWEDLSSDHRQFCKKEAYQQQLDRFSYTVPENELLGDGFIKRWEKWIKTDKMQKVLLWSGVTEQEVRPS
jgi:hypothetical protein